MPGYVKPPSPIDLPRKVRELERRLAVVESRLAYVSSAPTAVAGDAYDANKLWNSQFESGIVSYETGYWTGDAAKTKWVTETADPLDGQRCGRIDNAGGSAIEVWWRPSHWPNAVSGVDAFPTAPGKVWQLSCLVRSSVDITHARLDAKCGTTALDCYSLGANVTFVPAIDTPITAGTVTTLSGLITVPASRNFITLAVRIGVDDTPVPADPWSVWIDNCVLRAKL